MITDSRMKAAADPHYSRGAQPVYGTSSLLNTAVAVDNGEQSCGLPDIKSPLN